MIDRDHPLSVSRQALILDLSRSSLYYEPMEMSERHLALMAAIDEIHLQFPFYGSRRIKDELLDRGFLVGRQHVATLMRRMGIEPLWPKKKLSKPAPGHKIYPYLLRNWEIIQAAPPDERGAGIVDVLSVVTGLLDWRYAAQKGRNLTGQRFSPWAAGVAAGLASQAIKSAAAIGQGNRDALRTLLDLMMTAVQVSNQLGHTRACQGSEHYLAQILAGIAPEIPHSALVGPCLLLVSALHGQSPAALREALEAAGIRLDAVRPTDVRLVLDKLPDYLDAYDFPYSILNDIDPESEMVDRALEAAGLAVQPETWEVPSEASAALGIGAPGGLEADLGETRPADQPEDDLGSEQPLNG